MIRGRSGSEAEDGVGVVEDGRGMGYRYGVQIGVRCQ